MVEGGGGEDCVKAVGLHARLCACLAADGGELAPISRPYYQWGYRKVVKISKIVFHRFVQKWRLVAV